MGNQTPDDRKPNPQGVSGQDQNRDRSQPGRSSSSGAGQEQTGKQARNNPQDAGGTKQGAEPEGSEDNSIERRTDDEGAGRERQAGGRTGQAGERMDEDDIERPDVSEKSDRDAPGSRPR